MEYDGGLMKHYLTWLKKKGYRGSDITAHLGAIWEVNKLVREMFHGIKSLSGIKDPNEISLVMEKLKNYKPFKDFNHEDKTFYLESMDEYLCFRKEGMTLEFVTETTVQTTNTEDMGLISEVLPEPEIARVVEPPSATDRTKRVTMNEVNDSHLYFLKTVDWSTFHSGITVPSKFHQTLLQHLSEELPLGKSRSIFIELDGQLFQAGLLSPNYSDPFRKPVILIFWSKNSPIAKYMRAAYKEIYDALVSDKKNRNVLTEQFHVRLAAEKDHFEFILNTNRSRPANNDSVVIPDALPKTQLGAASVEKRTDVLSSHYTNNSLHNDELADSSNTGIKWKGLESVIETNHMSNFAIDPKDVVEWLVTQSNANGTLYLEHVVLHYMVVLRIAPAILQIPAECNVKSIFTCHTPDELNTYWDLFKAAPNYNRVDSNTSGMFSAALGCYMRYLQHISGIEMIAEEADERKELQETQPPQLEAKNTTGSTLHVDFDRPELRAQTRPLTCTINGQAMLDNELADSNNPEVKWKDMESAIEIEHIANFAINPEDVVAWLITQPNANGTLYLEHVVWQYMYALRTAPAKLQIPVECNVRSVFTCHTPNELNAYWKIFRASPNYKQVNSSTSGMLSAGMGCYMRYLQHLTGEFDVEKPDVIQLVEDNNLEYVDKRDSGGALWVIGGRELSPIMLKLRDSGFPFNFMFGGGRSSGHRDAWWYKSSETVNGQNSEEAEEAQPAYTEPKVITNSAQRVDFNRPELRAQIRPLTCTIKEQGMLDNELADSNNPEVKWKDQESAIEIEHTSNFAINPEDVVAWLITQPNANGTLYLEHVVWQYMCTLRTAPAILQIPAECNVKSIFTCHTPDELNTYWDLFKAAPNYKQVNSSTSGMFSTGMGCYMRYLQHISGIELIAEEADERKELQETQPPQLEAKNTTESTPHVDFDRPEICAQTRPLTCTINGQAVLDNELADSNNPVVKWKVLESAIEIEHTSHFAIDPIDVVAWLVTQPNANGTLYLEHVVWQYMCDLRTAPAKLQIPVEFIVRSVFTCHTPDELNAYWDIFKAAPNYTQVNSSTLGMFSAGMVCYMRYLQHLSDELNVEKPDVIQLVEDNDLEYVDKRDSGGALWVIGGREISPIMLKLQNSGFPFTFKVGGGRSSDHRDTWWYKSSETVDGQNSEEAEEAQPAYTEPKVITNSTQRVDFNRPELCAQTRPLTCTIKGQAVVLRKQNWSQLLVAITERFLVEGHHNLESLNRKMLFGRKIFFLMTKADFGTCSLISKGKWIYTNYNPQMVVNIIRKLCQYCSVDLDDVIITYGTKEGKHTQSVQTYTRPAYIVSTAPPKAVLDPSVAEQLTGVLSSHFSNGYRLNSPIEMVRFRSFAAKDLGEEIKMTDDALRSYIAACGTIFDGKVYAVSAQGKERIRGMAEDYFANGAQAIFYSEFYARNENWLFEACVVSEDMLIGILRRLFPKLSFTQTYFGHTDVNVPTVLESEILRVWGDDLLRTYDQLVERLRYIPIERIKSLLCQNSDFIWSSVETYSHVSRIEITEEERHLIRDAAVRECNSRGYASIIDLPYGEIGERNCELSITAVQSALYRICLSDMFDKKGKIITRQGDVFDAMTIMKEYCRTVEKCTLDDLLKFEKELSGEVTRLIPMEAGNTVLVRIDKDIYVADKYVHFNADIIDDAIGLFFKGDYLPLKSFTTFGAFPDCGQTWNLYLLESYCRRFSLKFRFDATSVNSRNAGVVIRKSCGMDYNEIMTDAVANADVPLKKAAVDLFLCESGYTARRKNTKISDIIDKAKAIREMRD